ncbi:MAG: zinc ribbon domain-containing protein [Vicinamibacterales bacterium]
MPLYEYECQDCHQHFEFLVRGADSTPACPSCQGTTLEKQLSVFAVNAPSARSAGSLPPAPCGSCGHPGGPGSCSLN